MQASAIGAFAPVALLCAAFGNWSLISLCFLIAFFIVQYKSQRRDQLQIPRPWLWMSVVLLAATVIVAEGVVELIWVLFGTKASAVESQWMQLLGLSRPNPWESRFGMFLSLLSQFAVALTAACALYHEQHSTLHWPHSSFWDEDVFQLRANLRSFVLPTVQILAGVARPSWIALPYFVCSCAGLLHWSMTSNFVGLSWGWRPLMFYTGGHITLLYLNQLPVSLPQRIVDAADYIGLFKVSREELGWPEGMQAVSLIMLYILLCFAVNDLEEDQQEAESSLRGDSLPSTFDRRNARSLNHRIVDEDLLTERLLPSDVPVSRRDTMASRRRAVEQRRVVAFQHATINFFTYGFPVCVVALICWSFTYASLCAFGLLLYVGYIFFAFPSIITLRRLNPLLLSFILSWALSTYVFNAAFSLMDDELDTGMNLWHTIGLWHYSTPGLFIFALYALGILVATDIFVSNNILNSSSEMESPNNEDPNVLEARADKKAVVLAVVAWCVRRCAHVISLLLIFNVGLKPGLVHAVYMGFFLVYLVSSSVAKSWRQYLILQCELHFALLYLLQLDSISAALDTNEGLLKQTLSILGLWNKAKFQDFVSIAALLCFSAVQNHGLKVMSSLSATVQQSPQPPLGWGILRNGNGRSFLLSVYASQNFGYLQQEINASANWVTKHLSTVSERIRFTYHMFGTYIAYTTVLLVIYGVDQNFVSFGYLCLLLFWIVGRQVLGRNRAHLWLPLMVFAGVVFVIRYILSVFPDLRTQVDAWLSLKSGLGFDTGASVFHHLWDPLAILIVIQLFRFERAQNVLILEDSDQAGDHIDSNLGYVGFIKRFLILHCGKLLSISVFYAAISPVSAIGFLYLIMLVVTCNMSKTSRLPGQSYAMYTALIVACEYLFQMWGQQAEMFSHQAHGDFAFWLGLRMYEVGFWGIEAGLRSKALVLVACILQCTTLGWLEVLPASLRVGEQYEEPCLLFLPYPQRSRNPVRFPVEIDPVLERNQTNLPFGPSTPVNISQRSQSSEANMPLLSESSTALPHSRQPQSINEPETSGHPNLGSPWGSASDSRRWSKRAMLLLKQDRYKAQLRTLSIFLKHMAEHFCQLYGLELTMLALLVGSFALLNVVSLLYILVLASCIVLSRHTLRMLWPFFVVLFACVMVTEYAVLGKAPPPWNVPSWFGTDAPFQCHNCWNSHHNHYAYCWRCWLGVVVDDRQTLVAHFMVFLVGSFQLRANMSAGGLDTRSLHAAIIPASDRLAWKAISYETTTQWTWLDHLRFFFYCYLLHVVLLLLFVTGTLQYDVLHLGYLAFSLIFFRMGGTIMERRNSIFWFLRLYNFILIGASLIYQAPYFGNLGSQTCTLPFGLYNIVGLYKYDYGFRITERSALVDITIFCLVGLQAHIFRSREFEQVLRYLEAQKVEARAHAQEHKAAWKKEQLQRIREMDERKQQRRQQVDKMKSDMLHMQLQLEVLDSTGPMFELADRGEPIHPSASRFSSPQSPKPSPGNPRVLERLTSETAMTRVAESGVIRGLSFNEDPPATSPCVKQHAGHSDRSDEEYSNVRRRKSELVKKKFSTANDTHLVERSEKTKELHPDRPHKAATDTVAPTSALAGLGPASPLLPSTSRKEMEKKDQQDDSRASQRQGLLSGVQLLEEGVAQVQSLGNKALANLVGLLNLEQEDDSMESSSTEDEGHFDMGGGHIKEAAGFDQPHNVAEEGSQQLRISETWRRLCMVCYFLWCQFRGNTDIVCYFFFVLVYVWNFSFLTLVFPATLFMYALLANPGPSQHFWLAMLIYTELNILLQYCYQIRVKHCDHKDVTQWWRKFGIPGAEMTHSFVFSVLPLFLVYLATLMQSSIKARDGEWLFVNESRSFSSSRRVLDPEGQIEASHRLALHERLRKCGKWVRDMFDSIIRGLSRYVQALTSGSEAPPHFVQVSVHVGKWPEAGIQPERIESGFNRLLAAVCQSGSRDVLKDMCSRVRVESIESSPENMHTALAVLEVIYAAPSRPGPASVHYLSLTPAADVAAELQKAKENGQVEANGFPYPILSVIPGGKREVDLYAYIFGTDLITFLFVALLYQSFVKDSPELLYATQVEDQFPKDFVFVLMTLFFFIVVDRVLYLSSFATGKVAYYFLSLCLYTSYVSQFVWGMEYSDTNYHFQLLPLRFFYMMKALSLALQALQIKFGPPHKSALYGQFLARRVNALSWVGFRLYRALPFLFELRCVLDWSCTTTALNMYDWLKLEDIYGSLFLVQCDIKLVRERHRLGQKQGMWIKFGSGVLLFAILIAVIWAPMLIYSSGNPTNNVNPIQDVHGGIEVKTAGGMFKLYQTGLCHIHSLDVYPSGSYSILAGYDPRDVQIICCEPDAAALWLIPPGTLQSLIRSIDDDDLSFISWWEFNRDRPKEKELAQYVEKGVNINTSLVGPQLKAVLNGTLHSVNIPDLYPRFFRVPGSGEVRVLENTDTQKVSGNLTLNRGEGTWWSFLRDGASESDGCGSIMGPMAISVSEEVPPMGLIGDSLSKFSIWSLYITFVLAVGRFIRLQCSDIRMRIPYENFPTCDRLLAICEDIYAARAAGELELEEGLFWTLIKIYRQPYILMEYTRVE